MVEKLSKHHVLSPSEQEALDRTLIKEILKEHNLKESVDIIYRMALECMQCSEGDHVDNCLHIAVNQFKEQREKNEECRIHEIRNHFQYPVRTD
jgi:hypothetical protein